MSFQHPISPLPDAQGLYNYQNEHDACGVGLAADLANEPSHRVVDLGLTILKRLAHRGAVGSDPNTGDGAGLLLTIPHDYFMQTLKMSLPEFGFYGVGMIFGCDTQTQKQIESMIEAEGCEVISWRDVPHHQEHIGQAAQATCPTIQQVFISGSSFTSPESFGRKLYVIRRIIENTIPSVYICSMSNRTIVYKGLLLAHQLELFYPDLSHENFKTAIALVHQRYSTNTFPTWQLAHPFRFLAHNGEINTLRGNLNQIRAKEAFLASPLFGDDISKIFPVVTPNQSDSASLDNMFELLVQGGRSIEHAMLMMMPQAWGKKYHLSRDVRAFFEYHSALMEPWDGPAAVGFTDGINVGAMLDRNGLRPARYTLTKDGIFVLASETGVIDFPVEDVVKKGRLKPGEIILCDLQNHRLLLDDEVKKSVARRQPYRRWCAENRMNVHGLFSAITAPEVPENLRTRQRIFGYTREDVSTIIKPMSKHGQEPVGSMGNDAALAILSDKPQLLFNYFKQLFAQVTNPPIDPIREELVMSLTTYIGNRGNILDETPDHARIIKLDRPILTYDELTHLCELKNEAFKTTTLRMEFPVNENAMAMEYALDSLGIEAVAAVKSGYRILILSDENLSPNCAPIPSLLASVAVNRALSAAGLRPEVGIIVASGEVREVMHYALLLGYGATAICPYLALETVSASVTEGTIKRDRITAVSNYIKAVDKGLLKVMSKMGISTLRSYRGGQAFEAVGLDENLVNRYFTGTASRIGGIGIAEIAEEARRRYNSATSTQPLLPVGGNYVYREEGEHHLWTPQSLSVFRQAVMENNRAKYDEYASLINNQEKHLCTLRGLFEFAPVGQSIPLDEVESVDSILKRFVSGAMSLGSLSPEAHEAIAVAMNKIGAMSNTGEGGEDTARYTPGPNGENRASAIKQIASGRFGVTIDYLRHGKEIQIKMAQGAKPGEGGQLPGHKVNEFVAKLRHSMPNVTLISPPPHHDIYSIEDLSQLIYDLRNANPEARISVKLVSEVGVGTIAAGVAKAHSDVVLISGHDGGTGASPLTSIKHAGLPWELGLAEAQQTLVKNNLRSHVRLQVDGQLKTGRDIIIGALLGAEEFGFATNILVCLGCIIMRKCHENSCPVGVATQDPELRKRFAGKPEYIINFLRFIAEETREYLAMLGLRSIDDAVGRADLLRVNQAIDFYKTKNLDFSKILTPVTSGKVRYETTVYDDVAKSYDRRELLPELLPYLDQPSAVTLTRTIANEDRAVGTGLSGEVAFRHGAAGLPNHTITVKFTGCAGQSFGAFLAQGITFDLEGEANDFIGKGLSGGKIIVRAPKNAQFKPEENVIAGNVIGYGATSGEIFLNGLAGERFAVRNSGITAVVEGVGDHGCEYMTGGRIVVLGQTGNNFGAGMTGGIAYVYDEDEDFDLRCNIDTIDLEIVEPHSDDDHELLTLLRRHLSYTQSPKAARILDNWENERHKFVKVFPVEYRAALGRMRQDDMQAVNRTKVSN